jgi:hypothetical protein
MPSLYKLADLGGIVFLGEINFRGYSRRNSAGQFDVLKTSGGLF